MERDELIEEISRRKGIAMEEVAEILDEEDAICLEEEEKFVQQMKKKKRRKTKRPKQKATQQEKAGTIPKVAEEVQVDLRRAAHSEKVDIPLYVKLPMIQTLSTDVILTMRR